MPARDAHLSNAMPAPPSPNLLSLVDLDDDSPTEHTSSTVAVRSSAVQTVDADEALFRPLVSLFEQMHSNVAHPSHSDSAGSPSALSSTQPMPISVPSTSPPLVSRPVSFATFSHASHKDESDRHVPRSIRYGYPGQAVPQAYPDPTPVTYVPHQSAMPSPKRLSAPSFSRFGVIEGLNITSSVVGRRISTSSADIARAVFRQSQDGDAISWARWVHLAGPNCSNLSLLFIGYPSVLQVWNCHDLQGLSELLSVNVRNMYADQEAHDPKLITAAALPPPIRRANGNLTNDAFDPNRPLIGLITTKSDADTRTFFVYSLRHHTVVKRLDSEAFSIEGFTPTLIGFEATQSFVVINAVSPPTLYILSSSTFSILYTIHSASLVPYLTPSVFNTGANVNLNSNPFKTNEIVSVNDFIDISDPHQDTHIYPRPVFSVFQRLLAYASVPPSASRSDSSTPPSRPKSVLVGSSEGTKFPTSQAQLSHTALKVGERMLSGMKTLGGMAITAAKSRVTSGSWSVAPGEGVPRFFSRSAPADVPGASDPRQRRYSTSNTSSSTSGSPGPATEDGHGLTGPGKAPHSPTIAPQTLTAGYEAGYHVTILDLSQLLEAERGPRKISEFLVSKDRPVSNLKFSSDGTKLLIAPHDGQVFQVHNIWPIPSQRRDRDKSDTTLRRNPARDTHWHLYDLKRGRTSAVVEGLQWAHDSRWIAVGSRKHTVHVFAVNPYGGRPDASSHLEGRVRNVDQLASDQPSPTELSPLVRLRPPRQLASGELRAPVAFTFIKSASTLPPGLLPPTIMSSQSIVSSASSRSMKLSSSPPVSPRGTQRQRPTNFQDMLLFDPTDNTLYLRRFTVELKPRDQSNPLAAASAVLGVTSISLPGSGSVGRLSSSPSQAGTVQGHKRSSSKSGTSQAIEQELSAKEAIIATWQLRRYTQEVKMPFMMDPGAKKETTARDVNWLAHAELSTCSLSQQVLPRSIYLSHQFSFHTLGEDYHALVRQYRLDVTGAKIDVRKQVQVSAFPSDVGDDFIEGFGMSRQARARNISSSFDEPLASALAAGIDHPPTTGVLPMYPNGSPASRPQLFRPSIPIRVPGFGDGVSESIGRIKREIIKVRSPVLNPRPDSSLSASVPLEFDEEDEDFLNPDVADSLKVAAEAPQSNAYKHVNPEIVPISAASSESAPLNPPDDFIGDHDWLEWPNTVEKLAAEDAPTFDDVSPIGLLDEEQGIANPRPGKKGKGQRRKKL